MASLTEDVPTTPAPELLGGRLEAMTPDRLRRLVTPAQHATDLLPDGIERRGGLAFPEGAPVAPCMSDHRVETVPARGADDDED